MKRQLITSLFVLFIVPFISFAQKGVEDQSRFGHGEDSIRCVTNIGMYRELMRQQKYFEAAKRWEMVFAECPYSTETLYTDGARMLKILLDNTEEPEMRDALFLKLMALWDARIRIFSQENSRKRKNLVAWKALDMLKYKRDDMTHVEKGYRLLQESIRGNRSEISEVIIMTYLSLTIALEQQDKIRREETINNFRMVNRYLMNNPDQQLKYLPDNPLHALIRSSSNPEEFRTVYASFINSAGAERLVRQDIIADTDLEEQRATPQTLINEERVNVQYKDSRRVALVIGNSAYEFGGDLANPGNDADAIADILASLGFKVFKYQDLSQNDMRKAIDQFGDQLVSYDVGLFFYAGHGVQAKGFNYLIPVDALLMSEADVEYTCVRADRVLGKMEGAANETNIVILDACRNNPFERSWTRTPQGRGLAFMNAPSGSLIGYATSPGNTALDGTGENGLYTSALLKHIVEPDITIIEMFQKVRTHVRENSDGNQVPWESTSLEGNFYFVK